MYFVSTFCLGRMPCNDMWFCKLALPYVPTFSLLLNLLQKLSSQCISCFRFVVMLCSFTLDFCLYLLLQLVCQSPSFLLALHIVHSRSPTIKRYVLLSLPFICSWAWMNLWFIGFVFWFAKLLFHKLLVKRKRQRRSMYVCDLFFLRCSVDV